MVATTEREQTGSAMNRDMEMMQRASVLCGGLAFPALGANAVDTASQAQVLEAIKDEVKKLGQVATHIRAGYYKFQRVVM
eukprot:764581-Hanusia_phi.AAC.8